MRKLSLWICLASTAFAQYSMTGGTYGSSNPAPVISGFSCTSPITSGQTSTCTGTVVGAALNAGSITINNGLYSCSAPCSGGVNATTGVLTTTTTYTLTATNPSASSSQPFTVVVGPAPSATITPSPTTIAPAGSTTVSWTATNQNTIDIVRNLDGASKLHCTSSCAGSGSFSDSPALTTTYTITVVAVGGGTVNVTSVPVVVTGGGSVTDTNRFDNPDDTFTITATDNGAHPPGHGFYTALARTRNATGKTVTISTGCSVFPCATDIATVFNGAGVSCGDTIVLQAGQNWNYGSSHGVVLNSKGCDDAHWITIRTSTADNLLPDENTEITPCWANVASLPGRPAYACPGGGVAQLLPTITLDGSNKLFINAEYVRWIGVEYAGTGTPPGGTTQIIEMNSTHHYIFDRTVCHGTPTGDVRRCLAHDTSYFGAVINSYWYDFHCHTGNQSPCNQATSMSFGTQSQLAVSPTSLCQQSGGVVPAWQAGCPGVYKYVNNYIETAGENVFSGGGSGNYVPMDVEINRVHLFKPLFWNPLCATIPLGCGAPGSYMNGTAVNLTSAQLTSNVVTLIVPSLPTNVLVGSNQQIQVAGFVAPNTAFNGGFNATVTGSGPYTLTYAKTAANISLISGTGNVIAPAFVVENLMEFKNCARCFINGSIFENSWGGFSQEGYAVLLSPKSQNAACLTDVFPVCYDSDIIIKNIKITGASAVFQLAANIGNSNGIGPPVGLTHASIHDVVSDANYQDANSTSYALEYTSSCNDPIGFDSVVVDHVSFVKIVHGAFLVGNDNKGSPCFFTGMTIKNSIIDTGSFPMSATNTTIGCQAANPSHTPIGIFNACFPSAVFALNVLTNSSGSWPAGFTLLAGAPTIYTNYNGGNGGDYTVTVGSGLRNAGTDGKDIGACISCIATETAGIP